MPETGWQHSRGLGGNIPLDYVATFPWTGWQKSVEYALGRAVWDADAVRNDLCAYVIEALGNRPGSRSSMRPSFSKKGAIWRAWPGNIVAGAKCGRATTTLVESQRVRTPTTVPWTSHS